MEENEKAIFLDIACFFNTCDVGYVTQMLHARSFHAGDGLRVLVDRSLINVYAPGFVRMRDLIQETGREIVRHESILEPGNEVGYGLMRTLFMFWKKIRCVRKYKHLILFLVFSFPSFTDFD